MKRIKNTFTIIILLFITASCLGQKSQVKKINKTINVKSEAKCNDKDGYWYKGKCWANFKEFDENITKADSKISSGGVDLFCAGKERTVTKGAELGIHSWGETEYQQMIY